MKIMVEIPIQSEDLHESSVQPINDPSILDRLKGFVHNMLISSGVELPEEENEE